MRFRLLTALTALSLALAPPFAAAASSIYSQVLDAYQANGSIPPCQFTSVQLQQALKGVDTYGEQYFADFTNAIQTALAARASGACSPSRASGLKKPAATTQRFVVPAVTGATGSDLPVPILVFAGLTVAAAGGGAVALLWRARGWDPRWASWLRHAAGETAHRAASGLDRHRRS